MKHYYLAHRSTGKKPLPSKSDNAIRESMIHAGRIKPGLPGAHYPGPKKEDRPFKRAVNTVN